MARVLVIGGTRYFGKRLVALLQAQGHRVSLHSRETSAVDLGPDIERIRADREREDELAENVGRRDWDVVFDQVCYASSQAIAASRIFAGRVGRYVVTSSESVYDGTGELREEHFDPLSHPLRLGSRADFDYGEGERQAEALRWVGSVAATEPLNACSDGQISMREMIGLVEWAVGDRAILADSATDEQRTPLSDGG